MAEAVRGSEDLHRRRLFFGICLALIPTGASFALVSNILVPLKQQFILTNYQVGLIGGAALWGMAISLLVMGPLLEGFGLKNGARLAFLGPSRRHHPDDLGGVPGRRSLRFLAADGGRGHARRRQRDDRSDRQSAGGRALPRSEDQTPQLVSCLLPDRHRAGRASPGLRSRPGAGGSPTGRTSSR